MNSLIVISPSEQTDHLAPAQESSVVAAGGRVNHRSGSTWDANLSLELAVRGVSTRLVYNRHHGPLYVQKPFYPEGPAIPHIYLLHPPGGLVSGDRLEIEVKLGSEASALFTTPGAARIYRAREGAERWQIASQILRVGDGASVEWLPAETIVYPGACTRLETRIELASMNSRLIAWELISLGLPARGETFDRGSLNQRLSIFLAGKPWLIDGLNIEPDTRDVLTGAAGMAGYPVFGWCIAGPFIGTARMASVARLLIDLQEESGHLTIDLRGGVTLLNHFLLIRVLSNSVMSARNHLQSVWYRIRPLLLDRAPVPPRIWNT